MKLPSFPPILHSDRLLLRALGPEDSRVVSQLAGAREIADTTLTVPHPYEEKTAREWLSHRPRLFQAGSWLDFAMVLKGTETVCGVIGLVVRKAHFQAELGYWVGVPYWKQGYCTEAGRTLVRWGFEEMGLHRICAHHLTRNPASGRVLGKLGFRHEGTLRGAIFKWDKFENVEVYGLLREEWEDRSEHRTSNIEH